MASYVANHIPVICPTGLLRSTNSFPMNLSLFAQSKVTKRKGIPVARASHTRSLDEVKRNPGLFNAAGHSRITLRFIQATI